MKFDDIIEEYRDLYLKTKDDEDKDDYSVFFPMWGQNYFNCNTRFFLIGRANNGWYFHFDYSLDFDSNKSKIGNNGFNWIKVNKNGKLSNGNGYFINSKPYWGIAGRIFKKITGINETKWVNNIVWSNIYKVFPSYKGNPNDDLRLKQGEICKKILKKELDFFNPTHVLFFTDYDNWFTNRNSALNFSDIFSDVNKVGKEVVLKSGGNKEKNIEVVKGRAKYYDAKVLITARPEYVSRQGVLWDKMADLVVDCYKNLY